jgi:hypothetical protein
MKGIDNCPEPFARFHYSHPVLIEEHLDGVVLTRAGEAEMEVATVVPAGLPGEGPAAEAESVTDRLRKSHVVFHVDKFQRSFPGNLFVPGLTEVVVEVERADAENQQVTRAKETGVNVNFQK